MAHDPEKVPLPHADLFYHGEPDEYGDPVGLSDTEYDSEKAQMIAHGTWPFPAEGYEPPAAESYVVDDNDFVVGDVPD